MKEKNCVVRTYQVYNFWTMSAMESQKAAEDSQNKENVLLACATKRFDLFPAGSRNKKVIIGSY